MMKSKSILLVSTILTGVLLYFLSYETLRAENVKVQLLFFGLFAIYGIQLFLLVKKNWQTTLTTLFLSGLVLRVLLLFSTPNLSDDYYRFTWDGYLSSQGHDPFAYTPEEYLVIYPDDTTAQKLFNAHSANFQSGMNSKGYYSIYPTVNQAVFVFSYWVTGSPNSWNLVVMKIIILLFECFTFFVLTRLLRLLKKPVFLASLYWLNPLVIVEFTGNLHFDGIALTFLLYAVYSIYKGNLIGSGVALAGAVATKLNPVFLACINWRELKFKKLVAWGLIAGICSVGLLALVISPENIENFFKSFRLYFYVFQFNSSTIKLSAYLFGYEGLSIAMAVLPVLTLIGILSLNLLNGKWGIAEKLILAFTIYYLFGTTVHPWYILVLLPFAILSNWIFPFIWSYVIVWTYSFYHVDSVDQSGWLILVEYLIVLSFLAYDISSKVKGRNALREHVRTVSDSKEEG